MKTKSLYLVPWVESEPGWGLKPEGYKVFSDLKKCIKSTKESSAKGASESGYYFGPQRPLYYIEVPFDKNILKEGWTKMLPKFRSDITYID